MDVMYSMVSVNSGRENNRRDLVINYCKTLELDLELDFSILQETQVTFSHLHDIREL